MNQMIKRRKKTPRVNLPGAFFARTDLSYTNLEAANLSKANATGVTFRGSNMKNTKLDGTILIGADLTNVKNLTLEQLRQAIVDETTILPDYIDGSQLNLRGSNHVD